jgi:hypothetical protein
MDSGDHVEKGVRRVRKSLTAIIASAALVLVLAVPAMAHPAVPPQSVCVIPGPAAFGGHMAFSKVSGVAAHVLFVKSPHFCQK